MHVPEPIRIGSKVCILEPDYLADEIGIVLGPEELQENSPSDRWLIQLEASDAVVSLSPDEFQVLE